MIRKAELKDISRISELLYQVNDIHHKGRPDLFVEGARKYTEEELKAIFSGHSTPVFVATDDSDTVVGYAFCILQQKRNGHSLKDIKTLYIDDLCVDEQSRGKHIGTSLYHHVLEFAKMEHCYNVTLNVWTCNPSAMSFYEKIGLRQQKIGMEKIL